MKTQCVLRRRQQSRGLQRNGDAGGVVQMHDAERIRARRVNGRVQGETRRIDRMLAGSDDVAGNVDLYQVRGADLVEGETERIDQKVARLVRDACRDVRVDEVVPAVYRGETIGGGQIDPGLLLRGGQRARCGDAPRGRVSERHNCPRSHARWLLIERPIPDG
jgi:hypothetical protein